MSTRGFVGYRLNKKAPKGFYNHSDSYPSCLGDAVVEKAMTHSRDELLAFFKRIKFIKNDQDAYENHKEVFELDWSKDSTTLEDGGTFYKDGLFAEWSYIFNFDNNTLEVYKGFGKEPTKGLEKWYEETVYPGEKAKRYYVNRVSVTPLSAFRFDKTSFIKTLENID